MKLNDLHKDKAAGFKTPEGYFSNLEENIFHQSKLKSRISSHGFTVPHAYFDTLEDTVLSKLKTEKPTKVISLKSKSWLYLSSIAATIALLISLTLFNNKSFTFSSLNNETIETYILNQDINTSEMAALIINSNAFESEILQESISDNSIETYLESTIELEDFLYNN